jgi:hypothetical protein
MKPREIALQKALALLRLPGHRLMLMHVSCGPGIFRRARRQDKPAERTGNPGAA